MLPAMLGLATEEPEISQGRIDVLIGEGQTAQVLRNLCLRVREHDPGAWEAITASIQRTFGVALLPPARDAVRGTGFLTGSWSPDTKVSDDVLPPIFANYYKSLGLTDIMAKADYHELVAYKDPTTIDPEVTEVLDKLLAAIG